MQMPVSVSWTYGSRILQQLEGNSPCATQEPVESICYARQTKATVSSSHTVAGTLHRSPRSADSNIYSWNMTTSQKVFPALFPTESGCRTQPHLPRRRKPRSQSAVRPSRPELGSIQ